MTGSDYSKFVRIELAARKRRREDEVSRTPVHREEGDLAHVVATQCGEVIAEGDYQMVLDELGVLLLLELLLVVVIAMARHRLL